MSRPSARKCGRAIATCSSRAKLLRCSGAMRRAVGGAVGVAVEAAQHARMPVGEPGVGIGIEADHRDRAVVVDAGCRARAARAGRPRRRASSARSCTMARWPTRVSVSARVGMVSSVPGQASCAPRSAAVWSLIRPPRAGHPVQRAVVEHHRLAVGAQLHIELDAVAGLAGGLERRQRVLRRPVLAPQAAMRDRPARRRNPRPRRIASLTGLSRTSTTASTSTAKFSGSR